MSTLQKMTTLDRLRLERGAEHLARLGPRAIAELLAEVATKIGGTPAILTTLADYETRLTPAMIRAAKAGGFPTRLRSVPVDLGRASQ